MSEEKNEKLPKFDGTGYTLWKRRMDLVLAHHELLDVVEMDPLTINPFFEKRLSSEVLLSSMCFGRGL
jgi:hypothetical protein